MKVKGRHFETIWIHPDNPGVVQIIDQRQLPFTFVIEEIATAEAMETAIRDMHLRGAPLIGAAGALGMYLALLQAPDNGDLYDFIAEKAILLKSARPTAINLSWAVDRVLMAIKQGTSREEMVKKALDASLGIIHDERDNSLKIGQHGLKLIEDISYVKKEEPVHILTHCNAGWLACIDYGTATAPIYLAHEKGIRLHVWVDETRPRNQGAKLTTWELQQQGVPYTLVTDNAGGYLMENGLVDLVLVGSDRVSPYGDVVNKVGTYLKALAAFDNHVPFYAAFPSSTIDWELDVGARTTAIEERDGDEIRLVEGLVEGNPGIVRIVPGETPVINYGFDITPARLITGIITERGIAMADRKNILQLFPEKN
jgi:methylthioribose-1-phosphate isomerase